MAQLSDDCFAFGGALLPVDDALALIAANVAPAAGVLTVPVWDAAGRVVAADVTAPIALPPFDNAAVDGYAVAFADLSADTATVLPVTGRLAAGARSVPDHVPGTACRIFTGAPMPAGADTVFMQEDVTEAPDGRVALPHGLRRGANARPRGEDVPEGAVALPAGRRLRAQDVALAAALGLLALPVRAAVRVGVFSTGDEVAAPGATLGPGQVYDSNRVLLAALLRGAGAAVTDLGILPDHPDATARAIGAAAAAHDLLVTSGGVSTGEEDHVRAAIEAAGRLVMWRLAIKPGRPVAMGVVGGTPVLGLPGNPVAVFVTYTWVVRPILARLGGEVLAPPPRLPVTSGFAARKKAGRREYLRVRLEAGPAGPVARKHPQDGAGVLTSLTETDGLVELPEAVTTVAPGDALAFMPWEVLG